MNITPENALEIQHQEWLNHPTTRQMLHIMEKYKDSLVNALSKTAGNTESDAYFHRVSMSIKTLDTVKSWITNTEQFVKQTNK